MDELPVNNGVVGHDVDQKEFWQSRKNEKTARRETPSERICQGVQFRLSFRLVVTACHFRIDHVNRSCALLTKKKCANKALSEAAIALGILAHESIQDNVY